MYAVSEASDNASHVADSAATANRSQEKKHTTFSQAY